VEFSFLLIYVLNDNLQEPVYQKSLSKHATATRLLVVECHLMCYCYCCYLTLLLHSAGNNSNTLTGGRMPLDVLLLLLVSNTAAGNNSTH
jgi:hypothetical protein